MNKKSGLIVIALLVIAVIVTLVMTKFKNSSTAKVEMLSKFDKSNPSSVFYSTVSRIIFITNFHKEFLNICVQRKGITQAEKDKVEEKWSIRNKKYVDLAWATKGLDENSKNKQKYFSMLTRKRIIALAAINKELKNKRAIAHVCKHQLSIVKKGDYDLANYPKLVKYYPTSVQYLEKIKKMGPASKTQFNVY